MIKKFLLIFVLLFLAAPPSIAQEVDESFTSVEEGQKVPYSGYLFRPEALAKIYTDVEQQEKAKELEFESKLKAIQLDLAKLKDIHRVELETKDLLYERVTKAKDATISDLSGTVAMQKWLIAGAFVLGIFAAGGTVYYLSSAVK